MSLCNRQTEKEWERDGQRQRLRQTKWRLIILLHTRKRNYESRKKKVFRNELTRKWTHHCAGESESAARVERGREGERAVVKHTLFLGHVAHSHAHTHAYVCVVSLKDKATPAPLVGAAGSDSKREIAHGHFYYKQYEFVCVCLCVCLLASLAIIYFYVIYLFSFCFKFCQISKQMNMHNFCSCNLCFVPLYMLLACA